MIISFETPKISLNLCEITFLNHRNISTRTNSEKSEKNGFFKILKYQNILVKELQNADFQGKIQFSIALETFSHKRWWLSRYLRHSRKKSGIPRKQIAPEKFCYSKPGNERKSQHIFWNLRPLTHYWVGSRGRRDYFALARFWHIFPLFLVLTVWIPLAKCTGRTGHKDCQS